MVGTFAGAVGGGATQVAANALTGQSLTEGLTRAVLVGAAAGGVGGAVGYGIGRALAAGETGSGSAEVVEAVEIETAGRSGRGVSPYEVDIYNELQKRSVVGDMLDIHHTPQKVPARRLIQGYDERTGPSIAIPQKEHAIISGLQRGRNVSGWSARQLLAHDIWLLKTHSNAPNASLRQLIELNKEMYPIMR